MLNRNEHLLWPPGQDARAALGTVAAAPEPPSLRTASVDPTRVPRFFGFPSRSNPFHTADGGSPLDETWSMSSMALSGRKRSVT